MFSQDIDSQRHNLSTGNSVCQPHQPLFSVRTMKQTYQTYLIKRAFNNIKQFEN